MKNKLAELGRRLMALFHRGQLDADLEEEMRLHQELREQEQIERGVSPEEARYAARRCFGNALVLRERSRDMWGWNSIETLWQDLRYGLRQLRRNPGFTAVAVVTLALAIGANTAVFSVVNAVLLRPLPFKNAGKLVELWQTVPRKGEYEDTVCYRNLLDWQSDNHTFEGMAAYRDIDATLTGEAEPEVVPGAAVSANLFQILGVKPILGRAFRPADNETGSSPVALLGENLWRSRFSADRRILGKIIQIDQRPFSVVGVLPASFHFPYQGSPTEVWLPIIDDPEIGALVMRRGAAFWEGVGRLQNGITVKQAGDDLNLIAAHLAAEFPKTNKGSGVRLVPLHTQLVQNVRPALLVMLGAVFLVLLIACVNLGNLLLARSTSRAKEIAVRSALGASHRRLVRQMLTESILFGVLGGVAGLLLAWPVTMALVGLSATDLPEIHRVNLSGWVLAFTAAISVGAGLIFGLAPALVSATPDLQHTLKDSRRTSGGVGHGPLRATLVVSEIAFAMILSVGAGLLIRSFARLIHVDLGFNPQQVLTMQISLPRPSFANRQRQALFCARLLGNLRALPGVREAGATTALPLNGFFGVSFAIPGRPAQYNTGYTAVSRDYFRTMQIPVVKGRPFGGQDNAKSVSVAIINQVFARRYFPNKDPLGQHLMLNGIEGHHEREIVGVVGDVKQTGLAAGPVPQVYVPYMQSPIPFWGGVSFVLRTPLKPEGLAAVVRKQIHALDNEIPVQHLQPMDSWVAASASQSRFSTTLLAIFAGLALTLAAIGIYGVISYAVAQHTHDIGIRMALGAQRVDVLRMVIGQGLRLALVGVGLGIVGAFALTRFLSSLLYAVQPTDPLTFVAVSLLLTGVALPACYIPAHRAAKVDPMEALRYE